MICFSFKRLYTLLYSIFSLKSFLQQVGNGKNVFFVTKHKVELGANNKDSETEDLGLSNSFGTYLEQFS